MSRNTQYQFISTDTNALVSALVSGYEKITGVSVQPASPEKGYLDSELVKSSTTEESSSQLTGR